MTNKNTFPLKYYERNYLVISSCFFLIPAIIAFCYRAHILGATSSIVSLISVNYWRHAIPGWRKTFDLIVAKVSFVFYFITGCLHVRENIYHIIGWPVCALIIYFYLKSNSKWDKNCTSWVYHHVLFHLFVALEQTVVIVGGYKSFTGLQ